MRLEIDIPKHHYNNIMALDSVSLGRVPYKGIIMYTINAIKHGKVLEQEPTTKNDLEDDCISRDVVKNYIQAHIHEIITESGEDKNKHTNRVLRSMIHRVDCMPSVTPQEPKIIPIAEIKYDKDKLKELVNKAVLTVAPQEPQIFKWCDTCREYDQEKHCCHRWSKVIRDTVEEMKQEQEPKTGHWIDSSNGWMCSECKCDSRKDTDYCPNCGADMREVEDGTN